VKKKLGISRLGRRPGGIPAGQFGFWFADPGPNLHSIKPFKYRFYVEGRGIRAFFFRIQNGYLFPPLWEGKDKKALVVFLNKHCQKDELGEVDPIAEYGSENFYAPLSIVFFFE